MLTDAELLRYSRQILLDDWDMDAQLALKRSRVLVVGVGGLGCPVAQILVRAGVGYVHLLDFDVVDDSNLQRQVLFCAQDVGKSKAYSAQRALQAQNPFITVAYDDLKLSADNATDTIGRICPDLLIDCTDNFAIRDLLNQTCRTLAVPLLSNSAIAEVGQIALFTQETGCYRCIFDEGQGDEQTCATSGVLASCVAVIGAMSAQIALDFLGRGNNPIAGEFVLWQGKTLQLKKLRFDKNPDCPICSY